MSFKNGYIQINNNTMKRSAVFINDIQLITLNSIAVTFNFLRPLFHTKSIYGSFEANRRCLEAFSSVQGRVHNTILIQGTLPVKLFKVERKYSIILSRIQKNTAYLKIHFNEDAFSLSLIFNISTHFQQACIRLVVRL